MNAWKWGLLGWLAFSSLTVVGSIGKPRPVLTPRVGVIVLLLNAAVAYVVVQA